MIEVAVKSAVDSLPGDTNLASPQVKQSVADSVTDLLHLSPETGAEVHQTVVESLDPFGDANLRAETARTSIAASITEAVRRKL